MALVQHNITISFAASGANFAKSILVIEEEMNKQSEVSEFLFVLAHCAAEGGLKRRWNVSR
jgi:hypothetical protein